MDESSYRYRGWRVVAACAVMAMFGWGLCFYGHGAYLAALQREHGWSASLISGASTASYIVSACLLPMVAEGVRRFGPRRLVLTGIGFLVAALLALGFAHRPWHLYASYATMSVSWAVLGSAAISTILGLWFDRRRGLAISLALNGASLGGILVVPVLVLLTTDLGLRVAMLIAVGAVLLVLVPVVAVGIDRPQRVPGAGAAPPAALSRTQLLLSGRFWLVAGPFAIGFMAMVGFLVHQVAMLTPVLGPRLVGLSVGVMTGSALLGRLALGLLIDRLNQRIVAATAFTVQSGAMAVLWLAPATPAVTFAACAVFGFSLGTVTTLPPIVAQREFDAGSFAVVIGLMSSVGQFAYALGPGLVGLVRDATGGYGAPLALCIGLQLAAAALLAVPRRPITTGASAS